MAAPARSPSADEIHALLDCCRYGDIAEGDFDDIRAFADVYGDEWLAKATDDRGNSPLHMAAGNGHEEIVAWLLPRLPPAALCAQNAALSTPVHWAALNYHLGVLQQLCPLLPVAALEIKNQHGKTAVQEAEEACEALVVGEEDQETPKGRERVRREKCVGYLLGCMGLGVKAPTGGDEEKAQEANGELKAGAGAGGAAHGPVGDDTVRRLTEQAEKIKLEQEEKDRARQEA
ncbi:hypothetical protein JCM3770_004983 [Rhodotorula araucariae]